MSLDQEDVIEESSTSEQEEQPAQSSDEGVEQEEAPEAKGEKEEDNVPFHMHPRFKEIVEQKNRFAEENKQFQSRLQQMERQVEEFKRSQQAAAPKQEDALIARLKGIDPEFAARFEQLNGLKPELEQFKEWKSQMDAERVHQEAMSTLTNLYTENKVPKELQDIYKNQLTAISASDPNLTPKDLPRVFKQVHEQLSKIFEATKREERKSYVDNKSKDARSPSSQPKGKAITGSKTEYSKDPAEARDQLVKQILKEARANKDI